MLQEDNKKIKQNFTSTATKSDREFAAGKAKLQAQPGVVSKETTAVEAAYNAG
jgi:hypothetical protein